MSHHFEILLVKFIVYLPKALAAVIGAIFSLVLSGDIDTEGKIKITFGVLIKFTVAVAVSLYGGEAFIEFYGLQDKSVMTHGAIMLVFAVFGILVIGIVYQAVAMLRGKPPKEIVKEIKEAFLAIFGG